MFIIKSIHNDKFLKSRCIFSLLLTLVFLMSVTSVFAAPWSDTVTIIDGSKTYTVYTDQNIVKDIIGQEGIQLKETDMIYPSVNKPVSEDNTIVIKRLKSLDIEFEGQNLSYWTDAETYRDFILKGSINADLDDIYDVNLDDKLKPNGNKMRITKVDYATLYKEEAVPFSSTTVYDSNAYRGRREVVSQGVDGLALNEYKIEYRDGVEFSRECVSQQIITQPIDEVVSEGTSDNELLVNGQPLSYKRVLNCQATAYDLSFESCGKMPGHPQYGITATGTFAKPGTVAVDPRVIPLGTKMYIVSADGKYVYGYCTAEDTGGAIKGNKVDLFYNTKAECLQFGRRNVIVYIL